MASLRLNLWRQHPGFLALSVLFSLPVFAYEILYCFPHLLLPVSAEACSNMIG